ncbi:phosphatase PAP2 family protein [Streptomyces sp. NPDC002889]|uniref:phosphatase PAP2 family protein n=1 Tax=Streptomyces sp. NPDC002889 TaxID=3364669 RepID=UPI0036B39944
MRETPRSQETAGEPGSEPLQPRPGRALAHTTGASGSETPHRSDGRSPQTPRGARQTDPTGPLATTPPVARRPVFRHVRAFALALCAVLSALVTWQVADDGPLRRADEHMGRALFGDAPAALTEPLADLGSMPVALPVLTAAIAYTLWRTGRWRPALAAALTMAAVPALVVPLKLWIARPGPLEPGTGWYPSGHTATAMVAYGGAALLLAPHLGRRWTMPVAVLLTLATGIGLVLRGYHWPLDVIGSVLLCALLLTPLACGVSSSDRRRSSSRTPTGCSGPS